MPRPASSSPASRQDRPSRRYQRTATEITSRGNRKPAKAELMPGAVTGPVSSRPRSANATVPFIPDQGETLGGLLGSVPGSCLGGDPADVLNFVPYPRGPPRALDTYIKPALVPGCV